jgi:hypothetical protein
MQDRAPQSVERDRLSLNRKGIRVSYTVPGASYRRSDRWERKPASCGIAARRRSEERAVEAVSFSPILLASLRIADGSLRYCSIPDATDPHHPYVAYELPNGPGRTCLTADRRPIMVGARASPGARKAEMRRVKRILADVTLFIVTCAMCLAALEFGFRAYSRVPLFELVDWRSRHVTAIKAAPWLRYDAVLGNTAKSDFSSPSWSTIDYGIRKNHASDQAIRTGGILAVGDSFTAGSGVSGAESWPAQLEDLVGVPVINAGMGGYGIDQMVLQAELLLPIVRPKVVVLGSELGIVTTGYSSFTWAKPYFTLQDGKLVVHNEPVPLPGTQSKPIGYLERILSYSYVVDQLMTKYAPLDWFSDNDQQWVRVPIDDVEVSCALLRRLKGDVEAYGARLVVLLQHGGNSNRKEEPEEDILVARCTRAMGVTVVDEYNTLHALAEHHPEEFESLNFRDRDSGAYGHMTAKGNRLVAGLVAAALRELPPSVSPPPGETVQDVSDEARNPLPLPEDLERVTPTTYAKLVILDSTSGRGKVYRLLAAGGASTGHFIQLPMPKDLPAAIYAFSLQVRRAHAQLRLQLVDGKNNGASADYDLQQASAGGIDRLGRGQRLAAAAEPIADGWVRISLTAQLPEAGAHMIVQLLDHDGRTVFPAAGEAVELRDLEVRSSYAVSASNAGVVK